MPSHSIRQGYVRHLGLDIEPLDKEQDMAAFAMRAAQLRKDVEQAALESLTLVFPILQNAVDAGVAESFRVGCKGGGDRVAKTLEGHFGDPQSAILECVEVARIHVEVPHAS